MRISDTRTNKGIFISSSERSYVGFRDRHGAGVFRGSLGGCCLSRLLARPLLVGALVVSMMGCTARWFSACTEASYEITMYDSEGKALPVKAIEYKSCKEQQGLTVVVKELEGKIQSVEISVDKSGTSEAAIAASARSTEKLSETVHSLVEKVVPFLKLGVMGGS